MALSILDGNQSATTLSTILSSGQHITAHTVVSLGTQAITDIVNATSTGLTNTQLRASAVTVGGTVTVGNTVTIAGTVTANPTGTQTIAGSVTLGAGTEQIGSVTASISSLPAISGTVTVGNFPASQAVTFGAVTGSVSVLNFPASQAVTFTDASLTNTQLRASVVTIGGTVTVGNSLTIGSLPAISGTVTANVTTKSFVDGLIAFAADETPILVRVAPGTNPIGVVTIGGGTVTIGAGTAQIGSVTASISGTVPVSGSFYQATQPVSLTSTTVTVSSIPSLAAGTAQIGSVTASISNTAITVYSAQGTTVTNSNFTSTTASTTLVSAVAGRDVLTVFNEGAGNLFISPGATATTISYQVRLSAGDYWECPEGQRSLAHTAVFATAGTARVTEVS
jgi:hypothetical protein